MTIYLFLNELISSFFTFLSILFLFYYLNTLLFSLV